MNINNEIKGIEDNGRSLSSIEMALHEARRARAMSPTQSKSFGEYMRKQKEYLKLVFKLKDIQKKLDAETNEAQRAALVKYFNNNLKKMQKVQIEMGLENQKAETNE